MSAMIDLQSFCDPNRETLSSPFSFRLHGKNWDAGTDGHGLVAVEVPFMGYDREGPPVSQIFDNYDTRVTHIVSDVPAFKAWLIETSVTTPCDWCKGEKVHSCTCCMCEIVRGSPCPECEGSGSFPNVEPLSFDGVEVDRCILARFLTQVCDCERIDVSLRGELEPIEFKGPGWVVVVMPRKRDGIERPAITSLLVPVGAPC